MDCYRTIIHRGRWMNPGTLTKVVCLMLVVLFAAGSALAQGLQGRIVGNVTDQTGAMIAGAKVQLVDQGTNQKWETVSASDGHFVFMALINGLYKITATMQGFNTVVVPDIKVDLGRTSEVDVKMTVGGTQEQVVVEAGAEVLQTQSTAVEGTLTGRSLRNLPLNNRDALDFVMMLPGSNQGGGARQSTFNNLPKGALSITMDGINIQDNTLKSSSGGMFTMIRPKQDTVEEVSVTTATPGADAGPDGVVQIKFTTRRGTNDWHGGVFEQYRDQGLNANSFFNKRSMSPTYKGCYGVIGGQPCRPKNHLNQYGFNIGGPIIKNKVFVFGNFEDFKLPASQYRSTSVLTTDAQNGLFTYVGTDKATHTVNLFNIAAANLAACPNCRTTVDPFIQTLFNETNSYLPNGNLTPSGDPIINSLSWYNPAAQRRFFEAARLDWDVSSKMRMGLIGQWNHFESNPDALNNADAPLPGEKHNTGGQYGSRWMGTAFVNYSMSPTLNYEFRIGRQSAQTRWFPELTPQTTSINRFQWDFPLGIQNPYNNAPWGSGVWYGDTYSTRNAPILNINNTFGWLKGRHTVNFGANIEVLTFWAQDVNMSGIKELTLDMAASDPAAGLFTSATMPAISPTDQGRAQSLYALLAGRISSIYSTYNVDEGTHQYSPSAYYTQRARQNILALFATDSFRATKTLTLNYGTRWEYQAAPYNRNNLYTSPDWASFWGKSGVGNLFKPGTGDMSFQPMISVRPGGQYDPGFKNFAPQFGFSWAPDKFDNGLWNAVFGGPGKSVFRGSYSIAYTREGLGDYYTNYAGSNPGALQTVTADSDSEYPAGSLILGGQPGPATLPALAVSPSEFMQKFPMSNLTFGGVTLRTYSPNLKIGYVQSWQFGIQRELNPNTVLELRYVGNRGTRLWRGVNINEVNIFENGFLKEFESAQNNLNIFIANNPNCGKTGFPKCNFGNSGLPGQVALPIMQTATLPMTDATSITRLQTGQAGALANTLATNAKYLCNLVGTQLQGCVDRGYSNTGAYPANIFQANPDAAGDTLRAVTNGTWSNYHGLQAELRRRMAKGLMFDVNYAWSHGLTNANGNNATDYITLRDPNLNKVPSPWDLRHTLRFFYDYELPFGPGRAFLNNTGRVFNKVLEGWELTGTFTAQSGRWFGLTSSRYTVNQFDSGVVLHGLTASQIQDQMSIGKQLGVPCASNNYVFIMSTSLIDSGTCQANHSLIDFPTTPGVWGSRQTFLRGPRFIKPDFTIVKKTKVGERITTEIQARIFNAFNYSNFMVGGPGTEGNTMGIGGTTFGKTSSFFNDINNQDQGPRMVELVLRVNF